MQGLRNPRHDAKRGAKLAPGAHSAAQSQDDDFELPGTAFSTAATDAEAARRAERRAAFNAALECLAELVLRCPANCKAAVQHHVIPILTSYISKHRSPPPNPAALRTLYQLVACVEHRTEIFDGFMSCLTIPALTRLLDASLILAGPEHRGATRVVCHRRRPLTRTSPASRWAPAAGAWAAEVLSVLAPLVQESQEAAEQLVTLGGLHSLADIIHEPESEPLPLSLMLDVIEVLVARGEAGVVSEVRQMLVRDGLLSPILQALRHRGLSRKAAAVLTHIAEVRRGAAVRDLRSCERRAHGSTLQRAVAALCRSRARCPS